METLHCAETRFGNSEQRWWALAARAKQPLSADLSTALTMQSRSTWTTTSSTGSAIVPFTSLTQSPSILCFNGRLLNEIDEVRALADNNPPQIVAVAETWYQPHEHDGLRSAPSYSLYRSYRPNKPVLYTLLTVDPTTPVMLPPKGLEYKVLCLEREEEKN